MAEDTEHHETRRKPMGIVRQAQEFLNVLDWRKIGLLVGSLVVVGAVFIAAAAIAPSTATSNTAKLPSWLLVLLLVLLIVVALIWWLGPQLRTSVSATTVRVGAPPPTWMFIAMILILVVIFWDYWTEYFPADVKLRLFILRKEAMSNLALTLIIAALAALWLNKKLVAVLAGLAVLVFFLMPDSIGLTRSDKLNTWLNTPSAPRTSMVQQAYTPPAFPPNTSKDCPGVPMATSLDSSFSMINPHRCFLILRVETGRIILSGSVAEKEVGPEGANLDGWAFNKARAKWGTAQLRYINCVGPKRDMSKIDCS